MTNPPGGQPPYGQPEFPQGQGYPQQNPGFPQGPPGYGPPPGYGAPQPGYGAPPPGYPGAQPPKKKYTGLIIALVIVALVVVGAVVTGVVLTVQGKTPLASDEKQIEVAIRDFYEVLDNDGFVAAAQKACAADRTEIANLSADEKAEFDKATISVRIDAVNDIVVTGDTATAEVSGQLTLTLPGMEPDTDSTTTEHLKKEDGTWKVCSESTA